MINLNHLCTLWQERVSASSSICDCHMFKSKKENAQAYRGTEKLCNLRRIIFWHLSSRQSHKVFKLKFSILSRPMEKMFKYRILQKPNIGQQHQSMWQSWSNSREVQQITEVQAMRLLSTCISMIHGCMKLKDSNLMIHRNMSRPLLMPFHTIARAQKQFSLLLH